MPKVTLKEIDKLAREKTKLALWKAFLFHFYNNPRQIQTSLFLLILLILALVYPQYINLIVLTELLNRAINKFQ